jgi:hypothetical protein
MHEDEHSTDPGDAEELLRRALLDEGSAVTVSLRIDGLPVSHAVTIIFYARRDLGTLQTYLTPGSFGAGSRISPADLLRVPCDLDLADAEDRQAASRLYAEQAAILRDVVLAADVVLGVWRDSLAEVAGTDVAVDHSIDPPVRVPLPRLLPTALVAPDAQMFVTPVCNARTLAEGRPPIGIALAQPDVSRVYSLSDDPERCVEDFMEFSAQHAREAAARIAHQEASVERFLEISA